MFQGQVHLFSAVQNTSVSHEKQNEYDGLETFLNQDGNNCQVKLIIQTSYYWLK